MQAEVLGLEQVGVGALAGLDLEVAPGEIACLSGPSGSGKSRQKYRFTGGRA